MAQIAKKDFWISTFLPFSAAMAAAGTLIPLFILVIGDVSDIGILSAISSCVSLPLAFIWGKLTDDSGKRKIFIIIMFISGFCILFGYFLADFIFGNIISLITLSVLSGLLLGAGDTAKNMYIFDKYPPGEWEEKISKYQQRTGIGACLGLAFGGLYQMFFPPATYPNSFAIFFLICAILCGISAVMGFYIIKDVSIDKIKYKVEKTPILNLDLPSFSSIYVPRKIISYDVEEKISKDGSLSSQITRTVLLFFTASFALYLASTLTFTPLPAFMSQASSSGGLEIPEYLIFWIYLSYYAVSVIGYTFAGNLIDKQGNRKILFIGVTIRIVIYLVFAIFSIFTAIAAGTPFGYITIILLLIFSGISYSLMNVALQNTLPRLITKNIGEVLALYSIIAGISSIVGSFFSGLIVENPGLGYLWLFIFSVIFAGIAFAIYFKAVKKGS